MVHVRRKALVGIVVLALAGCSSSPSEEGTPLDVPSDAKAQYFVLEKGGTPERPTILTKRVGSSGTSFSRREIDCVAQSVRYLGTGDTREQMNASTPDASMAPIVPGAIADYVAKEACRR